MSPEAEKKLNAFFARLEKASHALLLLDYDGTLAGFRVDRFKARPWAGVREHLARIQRLNNTRMIVITGRPPEEIAPMLALDPPLEVWGLHGAKRLLADGHSELEPVPPAARQALDAMRAQLRRDAFGGLYEDKPNAAVLHWRGLPARQAKAVEDRARELFAPLAKLDGLMLLDFEAGVELRAGRDKGGAVRAILSQSEPGAAVAYLGDDWTDEAAFRAVNAAPGPHLSVLMKRVERKTDADVWLKPPQGMREFLGRWEKAR